MVTVCSANRKYSLYIRSGRLTDVVDAGQHCRHNAEYEADEEADRIGFQRADLFRKIFVLLANKSPQKVEKSAN